MDRPRFSTLFIIALLVAVVFAAAPLPARAASCVWQGGTAGNETNWSTAGNWTGCSGGVPTTSDDAVIPAAATWDPIVKTSASAVRSLTVEAGRTLTIDSGVTFLISGGSTAPIASPITGTVTALGSGTSLGKVQTLGRVGLQIAGSFSAALNVGGLTTAYGTLDGPVSVSLGKTLQVVEGTRLIINNMPSLAGMLKVGGPAPTGPGGAGMTAPDAAPPPFCGSASLDLYGNLSLEGGSIRDGGNSCVRMHMPVFNNGTGGITGSEVDFLNNTLALSGTGAWNGGVFTFDGATTLANDMAFEFAGAYVNNTFDLGARTATFKYGNGPWMIVNPGGHVTASGGTFVVDAPSMYLGVDGAFSAPLRLLQGATTAYGPFDAPISVVGKTGSPATLMVADSMVLTARNDVTVDAGQTLAGAWTASYLNFDGATLTNNGSSNTLSILMNDTGSPRTQHLAGTGAWGGNLLELGANTTVVVDQPSSFAFTTLKTDSGGILDLAAQPLVLTAGTVQNLGTIRNGAIRTQGTVGVNSTGSWNVPLEVTAGTTTGSGTLNDTVSVPLTGTLQVAAGADLTVMGDTTIAAGATLSGTGTFDLGGGLLTNDGTVSIANLFFHGATQSLAGVGSIAPTNLITVKSGARLGLALDYTLGSVAVEDGATFDIAGRTVRLTGAGIPLLNSGNVLSSGSTIVFAGTSAQALPAAFSYDNLTINNPTQVTGPDTLVVAGTLRVAQGTLTCGGTFNHVEIEGGATLAAAAAISFSGNWANHGAFTPGTQPVTCNGSGGQDISGASTFYDLIVANTSSSPADAPVTALGTLSITHELKVNQGQFSPGDGAALTAVTIGPAGILQPIDGAAVSVAGDFVNNGVFQHHNGTVRFSGAGALHLLANSTIGFNNLTVDAGTVLVEDAAAGQCSVAGTLSNLGAIRKTMAVTGAGPLAFGLTGVNLDVTNQGDLTSIQVDRIDSDEPHATDSIKTGRYWTITPLGASYLVNLTLPLPQPGIDHPKVCKYPGNLGGGGWDCEATTNDATTVTRNGLAGLGANWAVGDAGPTALRLRSLSATVRPAPVGWLVLPLGLLAVAGLRLYRRHQP